MSAGESAIDMQELEALRRHGFGVAYRMLGSVAEAEDVAQEALLRLMRQDGPIDEPAAWMTTVATRLTPVERAAYLLREVFGYEYAEIAGVIERTEVNARQLVTRARKHLEAGRPRFDPDEAARDALLERFLAAAEEGDVEALEELLAKDAVLYADGGGKAVAPQEPLFGAALIARFMAGVSQLGRGAGEFKTRLVRVNGQPGRVLWGPGEEPPFGEAERLAAEKVLALLRSGAIDAKGLAEVVKQARGSAVGPAGTPGGGPEHEPEPHVWQVLTVDVVDGRIQTVRIVRNPDKLAHL